MFVNKILSFLLLTSFATLIHRCLIPKPETVEGKVFHPDSYHHLRGVFPNHSTLIRPLSPF